MFYNSFVKSGQQFRQCSLQVCLWENVLVDGRQNQWDAGHQAGKKLFHRCPGYCWLWNLWCKSVWMMGQNRTFPYLSWDRPNLREWEFDIFISLVQQLGAAVHQLHQWKTATVFQPPHVCPGARRVQERGNWMGVHWLWYGSGLLHWAYWEGEKLTLCS